MPSCKKPKLSEVPEVQIRAERLVQRLSESCKLEEGFGTFTTAWYDTAWLSMVTREVDGHVKVVFSRSLEALLRAQSEDGSWGTTQWPIDGLLNSLAALLCLVKHREDATPLGIPTSELDKRIQNAQTWISSSLYSWDVESCVHVGFEILVPAVLTQLSKRGVTFDFPQRGCLDELNRKKLARFDHRLLYTDKKTTLTHSLEAFVGILDFNKVKHHLTNGSMLGSPAATAAYLMNASVWDDRAAGYLEIVSRLAHADGGVPSGFPSSIFESSWAMSALLSSNFNTERLLDCGGRDVLNFLSKTLHEQRNIVGFYPGSLVDADDTAKSIYALSRAGNVVSCQPMIDEFETDSYFRTYRLETKPSFSANCNVLLALLAQSQNEKYTRQIKITASYLLAAWRAGPVMDKWNLSPTYSTMLLCQCLRDLLMQWDRGRLDDLGASMLEKDVPLALVQMASRLVRSQRDDGSWEGMLEPTAYAVIALDTFTSLPMDHKEYNAVFNACKRGREYIEARSDRWRDPDFIWVEKVSYGSPNLSEVYCIAAMAPQMSELTWSARAKAIFCSSDRLLKGLSPLMEELPLCKDHDPEHIRLSLAESHFHLAALREPENGAFLHRDDAEDEHLSIISSIWVFSSQLHKDCLPDSILRQMTLLSTLVHQVDGYMESTVSELSGPSLDVLETIIRGLCDCSDKWIRSSAQTVDFGSNINFSENLLGRSCSPSTAISQISAIGTPRLEDVSRTLEKFVRHVLSQPCLLEADTQSQQYVAHEMCGFLLARIRHIKDTLRSQPYASPLSSSPSVERSSEPLDSDSQTGSSYGGGVRRRPAGNMTYFDWLSTMAADNTSCPFVFAYFCCLMDAKGASLFLNTESRYLAQLLCRHLAIMCHQYKDFSAPSRTLPEGDSDGLDSPKFRHYRGSTNLSEHVRAQLTKIAQFERRFIELTLDELSTRVGDMTISAIRAFVDAMSLYGQVCVAKSLVDGAE